MSNITWRHRLSSTDTHMTLWTVDDYLRELQEGIDSEKDSDTYMSFSVVRICLRNLMEEEVQRLQDLPYKDYLQTDHWQRIRNAALQRADKRCQVCSTEHDLQVHHNNYDRIGMERPTDLVVLCALHHDLFHAKHDSKANAAADAARDDRKEVW